MNRFTTTAAWPAMLGFLLLAAAAQGSAVHAAPTVVATGSDQIFADGFDLHNQTVSFTSSAPASAIIGGPTYSVTATATSGLAVSLSIDATAVSVCAIAGSTVSFQHAGSCVIDASQVGNGSYNAAPQVQQSFLVGKAGQTISFTTTPPGNAVVGGATYSVAAAASSGLLVSLSIDASASSVCTIAGASVNFVGAGTCVIDANQAGNANFKAAAQVHQSFAVGKAGQTISFTTTAPASPVVGGAPYSVAAAASSALAVTLAIDAAAGSVCTISGATVSFVGAGTCVIDANQAGNANFNAASQAHQTFGVGKGSQTINFTTTAPINAAFSGATYDVAATTTSGLAVALSIDASASSVCTIAGTTVSYVGVGTCEIDADQSGNANWNAASRAQQSFAVGMGSQTISFTSTAPGNALMGGTYDVSATASSGLPVSLTIDSSASAVCSLSAGTVSFLATGACVIDADQAGNANWNTAPQAQQSFNVVCRTLAVGEVVLDVMPGGASFCVDNADAGNAEFTYMPVNIDTANTTLSVVGSNIVGVTGPPAPIAPPPSTQAQDVDAVAAPPALPTGRPFDAAALVQQPTVPVPLTVGQILTIDASVGDCSVTPDLRNGRVEAITTAQSVGQQLLYAVQEVVETTPGQGDWHPPLPGGFATQDFQNIIDAFVQAPPGSTPAGSGSLGGLLKTGAMDVLTNNFGALTDIDNNGGVIVFFTQKLNELVPPASSQIALGFFQSRDLFAESDCPSSNQGEIIYLMMPDPTGAVNSNVRTDSFVYSIAGPTLVHNFEHLDNAARRLYVNGATSLEETWLDEGLAWEMQELVFFNVSVGLAPRGNIQLSTLTTGPDAATRANDFNTYESPIFGSMRSYFYQLGSTNGSIRVGPLSTAGHSVVTAPDDHDKVMPAFGITSAFLRYAVDRLNTDDTTVFNALANTTQTGMTNLQTVLGVDPADWVRDFIVAMYTDDAVTGNVAPYTIPSWNYRSVFSGLGGFPLAVNALSDGVTLSFTLSDGGGTRYTRFGVAPGQNATIVLTQGGVSPTTPITTALVRTK